ncbi:hypothetical protein CHKEEEPN_1772 [Methylorubrum podarium]|nr:hypothetical protein CHKEEEPN_1772 [Methylorubrum podarium]
MRGKLQPHLRLGRGEQARIDLRQRGDGRIVRLAQQEACGLRVEDRLHPLGAGRLEVGRGVGRVEVDQHLPRRDVVALGHVDRLDHAGLQRLHQLHRSHRHQPARRGGDDLDPAQAGPAHSARHQRHHRPGGGPQRRRGRGLQQFQMRRQEGPFDPARALRACVQGDHVAHGSKLPPPRRGRRRGRRGAPRDPYGSPPPRAARAPSPGSGRRPAPSRAGGRRPARCGPGRSPACWPG